MVSRRVERLAKRVRVVALSPLVEREDGKDRSASGQAGGEDEPVGVVRNRPQARLPHARRLRVGLLCVEGPGRLPASAATDLAGW